MSAPHEKKMRMELSSIVQPEDIEILPTSTHTGPSSVGNRSRIGGHASSSTGGNGQNQSTQRKKKKAATNQTEQIGIQMPTSSAASTSQRATIPMPMPSQSVSMHFFWKFYILLFYRLLHQMSPSHLRRKPFEVTKMCRRQLHIIR